MKTNTLIEDLREPLDKVQRKWIRRPAYLILIIPGTIISGICGLFEGIYYFAKEFTKEVW